MAIHHSAETVGCAFTSQYYQVLYLRPEDTHKFYKDSSVAGWEDKDGVVHSVTTMKGINEMIMSSDYTNSDVQVKDVYAQDSLHGSILLVVTGSLTGKDEVTRKFSHTFLLARQERGFFVLNDILRFVVIHPSTPKAVTDSLPKVPDSPTPSDSVVSELVEVLENTCSVATESKGTNAESAPNPSYAEIAAEQIPKPSVNSVQLKQPVAGTNAESEPNPSYAEIAAEQIPKPSANSVQLKQPVAVVSNAKDAVHKTTYLETLSKGSSGPCTYAGSSVAPKPQTPPASNGATNGKILHSNSVPKIATPPPCDETMQNPHISYGIYVGGLPPNTTKDELAEAVKIFGTVKKNDGIQVILGNKNGDGFIYGFVHFESEESALKAVEAHSVIVRGKEAYITYKKSNMNGRGRSPSGRGGFRQGSPSGRGGAYNDYHNGPENGGGGYQYEYRNRSSEGRDRDGYQWNNGGWRGRRGNSYGGK